MAVFRPLSFQARWRSPEAVSAKTVGSRVVPVAAVGGLEGKGANAGPVQS